MKHYTFKPVNRTTCWGRAVWPEAPLAVHWMGGVPWCKTGGLGEDIIENCLIACQGKMVRATLRFFLAIAAPSWLRPSWPYPSWLSWFSICWSAFGRKCPSLVCAGDMIRWFGWSSSPLDVCIGLDFIFRLKASKDLVDQPPARRTHGHQVSMKCRSGRGVYVHLPHVSHFLNI